MIYEDDGDGEIAPQKNSDNLNGAIGLPVSCRGCGEALCTLTHFCGYCGFKNLQFDEQGFFNIFNVTSQEACEEMCTRYWHTLRVIPLQLRFAKLSPQ